MKIGLSKGDLNEPEWWCRHHKDNTAYLCHMIGKIIEHYEANESEELAKIIQQMKAHLPAFIDTTRM